MTRDQWLYKKAMASHGNQIQRCTNPKSNNYKTYGAKGIRVLYSFSDFFEWYRRNFPGEQDDGIRWCVGRIDHSKDYDFDNIRFETVSENTKELHSRYKNPGCLRSQPVGIFDLNWNLMTVCSSGREAAKLVGCKQFSIWLRCNKNVKAPYKKTMWIKLVKETDLYE